LCAPIVEKPENIVRILTPLESTPRDYRLRLSVDIIQSEQAALWVREGLAVCCPFQHHVSCDSESAHRYDRPHALDESSHLGRNEACEGCPEHEHVESEVKMAAFHLERYIRGRKSRNGRRGRDGVSRKHEWSAALASGLVE
jgi:hypothetical protein